MECPFYGVSRHQLWRRVRIRCPAAYLHLFGACAHVLDIAPNTGAAVTAEGVLLDHSGCPVLHCSWDAHCMVEQAILGNVLTPSGLWYHVPHSEQFDPSSAAKRQAAQVVISLLAQPALTPPVVLALWASLPYPLYSPN